MTHAATWVKCPVCHQMSATLNGSLSTSTKSYECDDCRHEWTEAIVASASNTTTALSLVRRLRIHRD